MKIHKSRAVSGGITLLLCAVVFGLAGCAAPQKDGSLVASAGNEAKEYKWTRKAVEEGTTVNAAYLWPDEDSPAFTGVYRDGEKLPEEKMVTITAGSVYHFRGISKESVLYTEVYVGSLPDVDVLSGESATWYSLLPSVIRSGFEADGWTWQTGWEYTGRAYLDTDSRRVMIKAGDPTAVLYGMGLYLDNKHNYSADPAFANEGAAFTGAFSDTENLFAHALEYYYTKGGELKSTCPEIYAMVADAMQELDAETAKIRSATKSENTPAPQQDTGPSESAVPQPETTQEPGPGLKKDLLEYANEKRAQAGLGAVAWDSADDENVLVRLGEVMQVFSQNRPDGTDAFTAYTDAVMCELRVTDAETSADLFESASNYFLMGNLKSFACATCGTTAILVFVW